LPGVAFDERNIFHEIHGKKPGREGGWEPERQMLADTAQL
jgi:hypothetical protein